MKLTPKRILFIQTAFLGDVVFSTALRRGVGRLYPEAELTFLASPRGGAILSEEPGISDIILYDKTGTQRGAAALLRLAAKIRGMKFDLVVSPHRSLRSALIARFSGARWRLGYRSGWAAWFYNLGVPFPQGEKKPYRKELELLRPLTGEAWSSFKPRLTAGDETRREARRLLERAGWRAGTPTVTLVPGTVWPTKKWPVEHFLQLGRSIVRSGRAQVVVIGGPGEERENTSFTGEEGVVNLTGRTSLRLLPAVLTGSAVVVAADTGPLHAAMALSVPVVALFGPTDEGQFEFTDRDSCLTVDLECRPCSAHGAKRCPVGDWRCLPEISVPTVLSAVLEKIDPRRAGDYNPDHFHEQMRKQNR